MADPFDVLSTPIEPVSPDADFATALRARLTGALGLPRGVAMTDLADLDPTDVDLAGDLAPEPFPRPGALPYLCVRGARAAIAFYTEALGARQIGEPIVMPDGRVGHCELSMGGGVIYLAEEFPDIGLRAPAAGAVSVSLMLPVGDADEVLRRARTAGATVEHEPADNYGRRGATLIDPFGHRWMLSAPIDGSRKREPIRHGDIGYVSWWTPDTDRAAQFYGAVLGWEVSAGNHQVTNVSLAQGLDGGHEQSTLFCCYAVDDVHAAVDTIRRAGGTAGNPGTAPYGTLAGCTDSGGTPFAVYQPHAGAPRPPINGVRTGDLTYVTFRPRGSSATARQFYAAALGWQFSPGHVEDGWEPVGVHPMAGMAGGGDGSTVPMWKVPDVPGAVERVLTAGGTVISAPEQQPYGVSAECLDDQGGRFYLGDA